MRRVIYRHSIYPTRTQNQWDRLARVVMQPARILSKGEME